MAAEHNLPLALSSFVGRQQELDELKDLLTKYRLVTITGPGGIGKTRLSLEVAQQVKTCYQDGIRLVELAAVEEPGLVEAAIAEAVGLRRPPHSVLRSSLIQHLQSQNLLLLIDNCEHLIEECAVITEALLRNCPKLTVLATSRENLAIEGEAIKMLSSLATPLPEKLPSVDRLREYPATRLFLERAVTAFPAFQVTHQNLPEIVYICWQLDGIPLALELAAALTRVLSFKEIALRLDDRFNLLTNGRKTVLPKHRTLRALIDWSYDLLSLEEQKLFRFLAVFSGSFSLEAAEAVCRASFQLPSTLLTILTQLVNKSLLLAEPQAEDHTRFYLLETLRHYGREKLKQAEETRELYQQHLEWFLKLAEQGEIGLKGHDQHFWMNRLQQEMPNFRSALSWSIGEQQAPSTGQALVAVLGWFWYVSGSWSEGRYWLEQALLNSPLEPGAIRAKILNRAAILAKNQGDYEQAYSFYCQSLQIYQQLGDLTGRADVLSNLALLSEAQGQKKEAVALHCQSLSLRRRLGDKRGIATSLSNLANLVVFFEKYSLAIRWYKKSLVLRRELKDQRGIAMSLLNLANLAQLKQDYSTARTLLEESLELYRELNDKFGCANSLLNLGYIAQNSSEHLQAGLHFMMSLRLHHELGHNKGICWSLGGLAAVAGELGQPEIAARLFGATERWCELNGTELEPNNWMAYERSLNTVKAQLGEACFNKIRAEGQEICAEELLSLAQAPLLAINEPKPEILPTPARRVVSLVSPGLVESLSKREVEVLNLISQGLSNKELAEKLVISVRTVEAHLTSIYGKLGVSSRSAALRFALDHDLVR